ncbi:MAG: hypothetical protein JWO08_4746, partial [Verrucomicrobiaceae bacterium]|nr:hypothetical protein [Verrucomicrobiaceae bacterium]
ASNGVAPYTWALGTGSLPPGLSLSSAGVISGTPAGAVTSMAFTVLVADSNGCPGSKAYTMTTICPPVSVSPVSPLAGGVVGTNYSINLGASGGSSPYFFAVTSGSLPGGLSLNPSGLLSGIPTAATTGTTGTSLSIGATDQYGCPGSRTYALKICPSIAISPSVLPAGTVNVAYSQTLTASGGVAPYTWVLTSGTLPSGITFTTSTAKISGTGTSASSSNITVTATDANGCAFPQSLVLGIGCPSIIVTPASPLAPGTVGVAYSRTLVASGGNSPYVWSIASGTLPTGLSFSSGGVISGTPTVATSGVNGANFVVQATDATGCITTISYNLKVCPVISITPASPLTAGTVGVVYNRALSAAGGASPYNWAIGTGTMPPGLSLSTSGLVSGTPSAAGTFSFTPVASDVNLCAGQLAYSLKICPQLTFAPAALPMGTVGTAYSQAIGASGGTAPYTYTRTAGTLPSGMSFSTAGLLSGTPTAANGGGVSLTFQATDGNACSSTIIYVFKVCPVITITPSTLPNGVVGTAYAQSSAFVATGGTAAYTWNVTGIPPGLAWDSVNLKLTGTPTTSGTYSIVLVATDSTGCTGTRTIPLNVYDLPSVGNMVFNDANNNGIKDAGESGIDGVTVTLRYDANGNNNFTDAGESSYATTVTSGGGFYTFEDLQPGKYRVVISDPPPSYPWASKVVSLEDDAVDNKSHGQQNPTGGPVNSPIITLSLGETNSYTDFGLVAPICSNERMVLYLTDLQQDVVEKFTATGSKGVQMTGAWGGTPWLRPETTDSVNGVTNPHGVWFSGTDVYIGGIRGGNGRTYRFDQYGQYQATVTSLYRLTHVTVGNYIYYGQDDFVSCYNLTTGALVGTVNLSNTTATTWGISIGRDGYLYVNDNYQSSTFPNGNAVRGSGHIYRLDTKPSTFTTPATLTYSALVSGLNDMTGIDTDESGNIYVVEINAFGSPPVTDATTVKKFSPAGVLLGRYDEPTPLNNAGLEDAWGLRWNPVDGMLYIATRYGDCVGKLNPTNMSYAGAFISYIPNTYGKTLSLQIECASLDMGDLPDTSSSFGPGNYQTLQEHNGPTHIVGTALRLGAKVDAEHAANPSSDALGDDNDGDDDEDGIASMPQFVRGQTVTVPVSAYNTTGSSATLYGFFDWSSNGSFADTNESVTMSVANNTNGILNLSVTVPSTAAIGMTGARFRVSTQTGLTSLGAAPNGEVEDYFIQVCPNITITPASLTVGTVGTAYSQALTASSGTSPYSWSITNGTLPSGLSLSTGGVISGTPTAATTGVNGTSITVRSTDSTGCVASGTYNLKICPVITITPTTLPDGTIGSSYAQSLAAVGGAAPYTWALASGSVPAGITLNSSGLIFGTPSIATTASFTVRATDAFGCPGLQALTLKVCPVITLAPTSLLTGTVGTAYSQTITASGGTSPYSYSVTNGTLPLGLTMGTSGSLSGTPTVANGAG